MKRNWFIILVFLLFGGVFCSISLVNHYHFRTNAFDLGIFSQAAYHYSTFQWSNNTVRLFQVENLLSDHFSLILIPLSFSRYLFGTYGLLIMQILAILVGGLGIFKLINYKSQSRNLSILASLHYFVFVGIYSALAFDFHNIVIGACTIPWLFYYLEKKDLLKTFLVSLIILSCKENLALLVFALLIGYILFGNFREKKQYLYLSLIAIFSVIYFVVVVKFIMPGISDDVEAYEHFKYSILGENMFEGLKNVTSKPLLYFKYLFVNHTVDPYLDTIKSDFWIYIVLSGGIFAILNPKYLPALALIIIEKMLNDDPVKWGIGAQYTISLAPIITVALFEELQKIKKESLKKALALMAVISSASTTYYCLEHDIMGWTDKRNVKFYDANRYTSSINIEQVNEALSLIPPSASISVESRLVPHLAFRDKIYVFPWLYDAEYIVLLPNDDQEYPLTKANYTLEIDKLLNSNEWEVNYEDSDLLILERTEEMKAAQSTE